MGKTYRIPTRAWSASDFAEIPVPNHDAVEGIDFRINSTFNVVTGTAIRDGFTDQLINLLVLKRGGTNYAKIRGYDLHYVHEVLQKEPHAVTAFATTDVTGRTDTNQLSLDISIPKDPEGVKAAIEITWAAATAFGTGITITAGGFNGSFRFTEAQVPALRCVPLQSLNNITGVQNQQEIPTEGQLVAILYILRANASPNATRDPTGTLVQVRIEGKETVEEDHRELKQQYKTFTNIDNLRTGVGLMMFDDVPLVRGSSYVYYDIDSTATDVSAYGFYTSGLPRLKGMDTLASTLLRAGANRAPVRNSMAGRAAVLGL